MYICIKVNKYFSKFILSVCDNQTSGCWGGRKIRKPGLRETFKMKISCLLHKFIGLAQDDQNNFCEQEFEPLFGEHTGSGIRSYCFLAVIFLFQVDQENESLLIKAKAVIPVGNHIQDLASDLLVVCQGSPRDNTKCLAPAEGCLITCVLWQPLSYMLSVISKYRARKMALDVTDVTVVAVQSSHHVPEAQNLYF